jgi:hypothetical protein
VGGGEVVKAVRLHKWVGADARGKPQFQGMSERITMYRCRTCKRVHADKKDAAKCCICKCGRVIKFDSWAGAALECDRCATRAHLISAHARVRDCKKKLQDAEKSVEDFRLELEKQNASGS